MPGKTEIVWRLHLVVVSSQCFWCFAKCIRICFFPENGPRTLQRGSPEHSGLDRHCMHCSQLKPYVWHLKEQYCVLWTFLFMWPFFLLGIRCPEWNQYFFPSVNHEAVQSVPQKMKVVCLLARSLTHSLTNHTHIHRERVSVSLYSFLPSFRNKRNTTPDLVLYVILPMSEQLMITCSNINRLWLMKLEFLATIYVTELQHPSSPLSLTNVHRWLER